MSLSEIVNVWTHFDKKDNVHGICKYCNTSISYKATTANLKSHLRRKHGFVDTKETIEEVVNFSENEEVVEEAWEGDSDDEVWEAVSEDDLSEEEVSEGNISKTRSQPRPVWNHFNRINKKIATCKYCDRSLSYQSTTGNLNTHLKRVHPEIYLSDNTNNSINPNDISELIQKTNVSTSHDELSDSKNLTQLKGSLSKRGQIWDHFTKVDHRVARCKHCLSKLSYRTSTGGLTVHLKKQHPLVPFGQQEEDKTKVMTMMTNANSSPLQNNISTESDISKEEESDFDNSLQVQSNSQSRKRFSRIWTHFIRIDDTFAKCKYCDRQNLSYKATTGNLTCHLKKVHPLIYFDYVSAGKTTNAMPSLQIQPVFSTSMDKNVDSSTYIVISQDSSRKPATIWKHFYKEDDENAICKYCSLTFSYQRSTVDLNIHLRKSHTSVYMAEQIENSNIDNSDQGSTGNYSDNDAALMDIDQDVEIKSVPFGIKTKEEIMDTSTPDTEMPEIQNNSVKYRSNSSPAWKHFYKISKTIACCKLCQRTLSYKTTTGNLHSHLKRIHPRLYLDENAKDYEGRKNEVWIPSTSTGGLVDTNSEQMESPSKMGEIWTHFDKVNNTEACCRYCNQNLSYKTTTGHLTTHLKLRHKSIYMAAKINNDSNIVWICNDSSLNQINDSPPKKHRKTVHNATVKLSSQERQRAGRELLALLVYDYQPYSIVEDRGFTNFVTNISEFSLPNKKQISKMVQILYEITVTELKEVVARDATSVCLSTESWTSSQNENYISITAHYTDVNFEPQQTLLECLSLNKGRTSYILSQEIKRIISEWGLSSKVIFAIADHSKNIEHSIENLGWSGYSCYSHMLNSMFLHALEPVKQVIESMNKIINHFKSNISALEMLVSYQMRNKLDDEEPGELIGQVTTHWTGTFFKLQRFIQLNEAIQYCMALTDTEWPVYTETEWELASQLNEVLETFEEVTSSIFGDEYMCGSLVIIITNCLKTICKDFLEKDDYSHYKSQIKEVISCVNGDLTDKFSTIEYNKDFALCTILDPRFKCYGFQDDNAFTDIKGHLHNLLIDLIDSQEPSLNETEVNVTNNKDVSAWDRFDKILKEKKPQKNSSVKAEREIQSYLDDDMMPRKNLIGQWNNPAEWWRDHKMIYPNLSQIYRTRCNIVATSVPWNRLHSEKGQVMSKRRSNLKATEAEKLVFLNTNLDEEKLYYMFNKMEDKMNTEA